MGGGTIRNLMEEEETPVETEEPQEEEASDGVPIEAFELSEAIKRTRRAKQNAVKPPEQLNLERLEIKEDSNSAMTLNLTDEFCRTLGDIPTYGLSG